MTDKGPKIGIVMGTGQGGLRALTGVGNAVVESPVSIAPTIMGPHGKAWLCDHASLRRKLNVRDDQDGTVEHWIIEAPWAHPVWHSYSILLLHLRPLPDKRETLFYLENASHEMMLHAMDPKADREAIIIGSGLFGGMWLTPTNFAAQFVEISDDLARDRIRKAVEIICAGNLSPDSDFINDWADLFGDNMMKDRPGARPPRKG